MDEFGSKNTRMVLLTVIVLAVAFGAVLLYLAATGKEVPDLVSNGFTTLLGVLTGSVVSLGAKPRVDQVKKALETVGAPSAGAGVGTSTEALEEGVEALDPISDDTDEIELVEDDDLSDITDDENADESTPQKETDASGI